MANERDAARAQKRGGGRPHIPLDDVLHAANRYSSEPRSDLTPEAHASPVRFALPLPNGTEMPEAAQFAISPDGTQVVVAARRQDRTHGLWLRRLQSLDWRELPYTDRATFPFWSPDGRTSVSLRDGS